MALLRPTFWTQQPQVATGIDSSNHIGKKVVYASKVADGCFDVVKNKFPVAASAVRPTVSVGAKGIAGEFIPASSQYYSITTATNLVPSYPLTVACWARIDSLAAGGCLYSLNGTGYNAILGLVAGAYLLNQASANNTNAVYPPGDGLGLHHIVCVHRSNSFSLYLDGILQNTVAVSNYFGSPAAGNHSIGNRLNGSSPQYFDGAIQDLYVFNGELSEAEAKSLYQNHWQIFKPIPRSSLPASAALDVSTYFTATTDNGTATFSATGSVATTSAAFNNTADNTAAAYSAKVSPTTAFNNTADNSTAAYSAKVSPLTAFSATTDAGTSAYVAKVSPVTAFNNTTASPTTTYAASAGTGSAFTATTQDATAAYSAKVQPVFVFAASTDSATASYAAKVQPVSQVAATTDDAIAAFIAGVGTSVAYAATTASPTTTYSANVSPVALFAATSDNAIFAGSAASSAAPLFTQ